MTPLASLIPSFRRFHLTRDGVGLPCRLLFEMEDGTELKHTFVDYPVVFLSNRYTDRLGGLASALDDHL